MEWRTCECGMYGTVCIYCTVLYTHTHVCVGACVCARVGMHHHRMTPGQRGGGVGTAVCNIASHATGARAPSPRFMRREVWGRPGRERDAKGARAEKGVMREALDARSS